MNCIEEQKIEKYAMGLIDLSDAEVEHIHACDRCRERLQFFKDFYIEFEEAGISDVPDNLDNAIILKPFNLSTDDVKHSYRLAAKSANEQERFIVYRFSNEDENVVCRVLQEKQTNEVSLYLISENSALVIGKKVKILGSDIESITDENGYARLGVQTDFKCHGIKIESPIAVFDLTPIELEQISEKEKHVFKLKNKNHDEIYIKIMSGSSNVKYYISLTNVAGAEDRKELTVTVLTDANKILSQNVEKGVSVFETEKNEKILKVNIY